MGETNRGYERFLRFGTNSDRVQFFSDAVFAIAMTLLVIDIGVPTVTNGITTSQSQLDGELWVAIGGQWQQFLAYAISFAVIGVNWSSHHRKFALLRGFDGTLVSINLLLLFFIAFVPYPTSLISEYAGAMPAIILYSVVVSVISLLQFALWAYSFRKGYLDERVDLGMYRYVRRSLLTVPVVFVLSIPVGFLFGGIWAMFFWILNWPLSVFVNRWEPKNTEQRRA